MTDDDYAARIRDMGDDEEEDHKEADAILLEIARRAGFEKTVAAFERLKKWYA